MGNRCQTPQRDGDQAADHRPEAWVEAVGLTARRRGRRGARKLDPGIIVKAKLALRLTRTLAELGRISIVAVSLKSRRRFDYPGHDERGATAPAAMARCDAKVYGKRAVIQLVSVLIVNRRLGSIEAMGGGVAPTKTPRTRQLVT